MIRLEIRNPKRTVKIDSAEEKGTKVQRRAFDYELKIQVELTQAKLKIMYFIDPKFKFVHKW